MSDFGGEYVVDMNVCQGWCKKREYVAIALNFFLDATSAHDGRTLGPELAVGLEAQAVPFKGAKIIMYVKGLPQPVITDFLLIACCHRVGSYLVGKRRERHYWVTRDAF